MATLTSQEILNATVSMGLSKANQCWIGPCREHTSRRYVYCDRRFSRNSYRTRASLGAVGWNVKADFRRQCSGLGLMLVVLCGADLFTGSCMTLTTAQAKQKITFGQTAFTLATSWIGNFAGALFVAFFIAYLSGLIFESAGGTMPWAAAVVNLANAKCSLGFTEALLRGIGCNWLVCLAVFAAAASTETIGKTQPFGSRRWLRCFSMEHCCQYVLYPARNPDRNRSSLSRVTEAGKRRT